MRRLPIVFITFLIFLFSAKSAFALSKFGPHIGTNLNTSFIATLRQKYDSVGTTDWVPLMVLVRPEVSTADLGKFLDAVKDNKFWPIIRLYNQNSQINSNMVDQFVNLLTGVNDKATGFPNLIHIEFGNEVNNGQVEWGNSNPDPNGYAKLLDEFIRKVRNNNLNFKIGNAAMNISLPEGDPRNPQTRFYYDAIRFWNNGPRNLIPNLDALFFNAYELEGSAARLTIDSWEWEWQQIGAPNKPIILAEYGFKPEAGIADRKNFVSRKYQEFLTNRIPILDKVLAVTPLLHIAATGNVETAIFGKDGSVSWVDTSGNDTGGGSPPISGVIPSPGGGGGSGTGIDSAAFIDKYVKSILTGNMTVIAPPLTIAPTVVARGAAFSELSDSSTKPEAEAKKSSNYMVAAAANTDKEVSTNIIDYITGLFRGAASWLGFINEGNKHAAMLAKSTLPLSSGEGIVQENRYMVSGSKEMVQTDNAAKVLGESIGQPIMVFNMENTVPFLMCESLPLGVGDCATSYNPFGGSPVPITPQPTGASPIPTPTGGGGGTGICFEGSNYCAVSYLKDYFSGTEDEKIVKATKASKICQKESISYPNAINKICIINDESEKEKRKNDDKIYKDYSVGLFQINLIAHCKNALLWHSDEKYCEIINQVELDKCITDYTDPDTNIRKAVDLSSDGTVWSGHWQGTAHDCGIP